MEVAVSLKKSQSYRALALSVIFLYVALVLVLSGLCVDNPAIPSRHLLGEILLGTGFLSWMVLWWWAAAR
jgi:hypothetical protein